MWAADFTHLADKGKFPYLASVIDLYARKIVGWSVMRSHSTPLVLHALRSAFV